MNSIAKFFATALAASAFLPSHVCAGDFQGHASIDARAALALEGTGLVARPVDRGLKLAPCPDPLSADVAPNAVSIRCERLGWRIRVPVSGAASASPKVIARGDPVLVQFTGSHFSVDASGIALDDAFRGGLVRVRIGQNAKPLTGEAIDAGKVRVRR